MADNNLSPRLAGTVHPVHNNITDRLQLLGGLDRAASGPYKIQQWGDSGRVENSNLCYQKRLFPLVCENLNKKVIFIDRCVSIYIDLDLLPNVIQVPHLSLYLGIIIKGVVQPCEPRLEQ